MREASFRAGGGQGCVDVLVHVGRGLRDSVEGVENCPVIRADVYDFKMKGSAIMPDAEGGWEVEWASITGGGAEMSSRVPNGWGGAAEEDVVEVRGFEVRGGWGYVI